METNDPALIIADGGYASLVACWRETVGRHGPRAGSAGEGHHDPVIWHDRRLPAAFRAAVRRTADLCPIREVTEGVPLILPGADGAGERGLGHTGMLLAACLEAMRRGIRRVVWPVQLPGGDGANFGELTDAVADAFDRALLVGRLLSIDASPHLAHAGGLVVQTPLLDLTDAQVLDLAADLDAPLAAARACLADLDEPGERPACGRCEGCRRWDGAARAAGVELLAGTHERGGALTA